MRVTEMAFRVATAGPMLSMLTSLVALTFLSCFANLQKKQRTSGKLVLVGETLALAVFCSHVFPAKVDASAHSLNRFKTAICASRLNSANRERQVSSGKAAQSGMRKIS